MIINDSDYRPLPDETRQSGFGPNRSCVAWIALAAAGLFVLFLWAAPGDPGVWGCPAGCHRDPWASGKTADATPPGNQMLFADPVWQKQQATRLLSTWGFATGKRSFVAVTGVP